MTTQAYISPAESARLIRSELKARHGWTSRQVSVKSDSYSMGSSIDIKIKVPGISIAAVEEVANGQERIHRCEHTGEILSGGNRYVSVSLDWELIKREAVKLVAWVEETPIHPSQLRIVEVCGERYFIGRTHEAYGYSVMSANGGFIPTGPSAGAVADFFARQMIQAGIEVVPPTDPENDGPKLGKPQEKSETTETNRRTGEMTIPAPSGYQAEASYYDRCGWKVAARPINSWTYQPWTDCGYIGHAGTPEAELISKGAEAVNRFISMGLVE
jgi:hypothetical protein